MSMCHPSQHRSRTGAALLLGLVVLMLLFGGCSTATPKVYHVGILTDNASFVDVGKGFKAKMTELGYIEGKNILYVEKLSGTDTTEEQRAAQELVDAKVDLILAYPAPPIVAAKAATQAGQLPVVFAYAQLEGSNLVKSVREPGGNMTGVRYPGPELVARRLELLLEMAPQVKRVWIGYNKNGPNTQATLDALRPAVAKLGITLVECPATTMDDIVADLAARGKATDIGLDAILGMPDSFNTAQANFAVLSKFAAAHKVPVASSVASSLQQGALFVNGTDLTNLGALAAPLADKVLKGTPVGTIPVVSPEQTLLINLRVAQQLGLTVPQGLLEMANQVIK